MIVPEPIVVFVFCEVLVEVCVDVFVLETVEVPVVEAVPPSREPVIAQPISAPTIRPATKIPTYVPVDDVFETTGVDALFDEDAAGADLGAVFETGGCDHDNEDF